MSNVDVEKFCLEQENGEVELYYLLTAPQSMIPLMREVAEEIKNQATVIRQQEVPAHDGYRYKIRLFLQPDGNIKPISSGPEGNH